MTGFSQPIWTGEALSDLEYQAIVRLLYENRRFDLNQYKDRCIRRRIAKRLRFCKVADVEAYLERLNSDPDELDALLATISIHVSQFFRNPETFQVLEAEILPDLCRRAVAAGHRTLRFWSVGCAGGEEAYSLALLIDDLVPQGQVIEILGTDISQPVLEFARDALYDSARLRELPVDVLQRYFHPENGRYRLASHVRDMVRFERHNIMTATDFPSADLILCRNVLIYFSRAEQARILQRFADVMSPFGVLVLGRSETLQAEVRNLFQSEYPVERIYRRMVGS